MEPAPRRTAPGELIEKINKLENWRELFQGSGIDTLLSAVQYQGAMERQALAGVQTSARTVPVILTCKSFSLGGRGSVSISSKGRPSVIIESPVEFGFNGGAITILSWGVEI